MFSKQNHNSLHICKCLQIEKNNTFSTLKAVDNVSRCIPD